jgi:hypothetical protein
VKIMSEKQWADMLPSEQRRQLLLDLRGVESPEELCQGCGGVGSKAYASTATWRGGIGGQSITRDICDKCWGSGVKAWSGIDGRKARAEASGEFVAPNWVKALVVVIEHIKDIPCIFALIGEKQTDEEGNPLQCTCSGCAARLVYKEIPPNVIREIEELEEADGDQE